MIVLACTFHDPAEFDGVIAQNFCHIVGQIVDEACPRTGIRSVIYRGKASNRESWQLGSEQFRSRIEVRIIDAVGAAITVRATAGIRSDGAFAVRIPRNREIIH